MSPFRFLAILLVCFFVGCVSGDSIGESAPEPSSDTAAIQPKPRLVSTITLSSNAPVGLGVIRTPQAVSPTPDPRELVKEIDAQILAHKKLLSALFDENDAVLHLQRQTAVVEIKWLEEEIRRMNVLRDKDRVKEQTVARYHDKRARAVQRYREIDGQYNANVQAMDAIETKLVQLKSARQQIATSVKNTSPPKSAVTKIEFQVPQKIANSFQLNQTSNLEIRRIDTPAKANTAFHQVRILSFDLLADESIRVVGQLTDDDTNWKPGELVEISFQDPALASRFEVPTTAVIQKKDGTSVLVVHGDREMKSVNVKVLTTRDGQHQIQFVDEDAYQPGMKIVEHGVHYLIEDLAQTVRLAKGS